MQCLKLKENFYYVGVVDHALKVFDVAVRTDDGTSYNSYLLKTKDGCIVFEGSKEVFSDEYLHNIEGIADPKDIKYLFVSHTEPDHSGAIERLLEINPDITIVASQGAILNLQKILRRPFKSEKMVPGGTLSIGGYDFEFVSGLMLHWPDVMFTYIKQLKTLVSCDAFGAHYAYDGVLLSTLKDRKGYYAALDYYFMHIMAPFGSYVKAACERVSKLDLEMICPGHGPVIDTDIKKQIEIYCSLADKVTPKNDMGHVTIVFASAYGYTRAMAEYLKAYLEKAGKNVSYYEINALNYENQKSAILNDIRTSGLVLLGSPTLVGDAICLFYDLLACLTWTTGQGKKASAFGDYGWSGEAVKNLSDRLAELRFSVIPGFRYSFKLDEPGKEALGKYAESLLEAIK